MVFEDDLDDYEDNVPAQQGLPVASIPSISAPHHALQLPQGRGAFTSLDEVPFPMVWEMRSILEQPMRIHFQGTQMYMTPNKRQIEKLVDACFKDGQWKTGEYHGLPSPKDLDAGVSNVCIVIATLTSDMGAVSRERANNMPARKEITNRVINHGETTKVAKKTPEKQKISPHRKAGSSVLIGIVKHADNSFTFKYYDGAHRALPNSYIPENLAPGVGSIDQAKLAVMKAYEKYWMERGLRYNMEVARHIARKRLTFYANGGQLNKVPEGEDELMKYFVSYKLIRTMDGPASVAALIDQVKAIPLPDLFSCF